MDGEAVMSDEPHHQRETRDDDDDKGIST